MNNNLLILIIAVTIFSSVQSASIDGIISKRSLDEHQEAGPEEEISHHVEIVKQVPIIQYKEIPVSVPQPVAVPVHVPVHVPEPVPVHIPVPYTILKTVHVPVEKPVPIPVEKPYPVEIIEKVPYPVPKPYPIHVPVYRTKHIYHGHGIVHGHKHGWD